MENKMLPAIARQMARARHAEPLFFLRNLSRAKNDKKLTIT